MKFTIEQSVLESGLYLPSAVAQQGGAAQLQPAYQHIRMDAGDGVVEIKATDSYNSVVTRLRCEVQEPGTAVVPAARLFALVKSFASGEITVSASDASLEVASQRSRFEFTLFPEEEYPEITLPAEDIYHSFEADVLRSVLDRVSFSMAKERERPQLASVLFMVTEEIARGVATDGHRLALVEYPYEGDFRAPEGILVPRRGVQQIVNLLDRTTDPIEIGLDGKFLAVKTSSTLLTVRTLDATFPPYEQVIPKYEENILVVPKKTLTESLGRIRSFNAGGAKAVGVLMSMEEGRDLVLKGLDLSQGTSEEIIEADYRGNPIEIPVNLSFVLEILGRLETDEVIFEFSVETPETAPILVKSMDDPSFLSVLMPLKM